jgi:hypothetical protein
MATEAATSRISLRTPHRVSTRDDVLPIWKQKSVTLGSSRAAYTDQENDRHVQGKSNHGIGKKSPEPDIVRVLDAEFMSFKYQTGKEVHDCADWSKVVEGNQGIHLELC